MFGKEQKTCAADKLCGNIVGMEILDQIKTRLSRDNVDLGAVAAAADISLKTVNRLRKGYRTTTFRTVIRITAALDKLYPLQTVKRSRKTASII